MKLTLFVRLGLIVATAHAAAIIPKSGDGKKGGPLAPYRIPMYEIWPKAAAVKTTSTTTTTTGCTTCGSTGTGCTSTCPGCNSGCHCGSCDGTYPCHSCGCSECGGCSGCSHHSHHCGCHHCGHHPPCHSSCSGCSGCGGQPYSGKEETLSPDVVPPASTGQTEPAPVTSEAQTRSTTCSQCGQGGTCGHQCCQHSGCHSCQTQPCHGCHCGSGCHCDHPTCGGCSHGCSGHGCHCGHCQCSHCHHHCGGSQPPCCKSSAGLIAPQFDLPKVPSGDSDIKKTQVLPTPPPMPMNETPSDDGSLESAFEASLPAQERATFAIMSPGEKVQYFRTVVTPLFETHQKAIYA